MKAHGDCGHCPCPLWNSHLGLPLPAPDSGAPGTLLPALPAQADTSTSGVQSPVRWQKVYTRSPQSELWMSFHHFSATNLGWAWRYQQYRRHGRHLQLYCGHLTQYSTEKQQGRSKTNTLCIQLCEIKQNGFLCRHLS